MNVCISHDCMDHVIICDDHMTMCV